MTSRRDDRRRLRGRRVRAVLAAGLVLGVGAFATLAAWNDTENATGSFGTSIFDTQSQSAGSPTYASNTAAPGATLSFNATGMSPGVSTYAWLNIRTTPATTVGGTVALTAVAPSGALVPALQYRAVRMASANPASSCTAATFTTGTPVFIAGSAGTASTSYSAVSVVPTTPVASTIGAAGAELGFCFEVRVATDALSSFQGTTATVTWTFTATSSS